MKGGKRKAESTQSSGQATKEELCCVVVKVKEEKLEDERGVKKRKDAIGGGEGV